MRSIASCAPTASTKGRSISSAITGRRCCTTRRARLTVQLGDGRLLAERTGVDVVFDLRAADVAAGGQGAPLVPVYHRALAAQVPELPAAFLNIGGVANVTWIGADGRMLAFDTGPGNALIDDWVLARTGAAHDADGALAAQGHCDEDVLQELLTNNYFGTPPPKSLDRNDFSSSPAAALSLEDGAATLTAFTAAAIGKAREHMPEEPRLWVVCGGGRKNRTLMGMIAANVQNAVVPAEAARPRRRLHRSGGLGVSRRALGPEAADHFPGDDRGTLADDRRHLSRHALSFLRGDSSARTPIRSRALGSSRDEKESPIGQPTASLPAAATRACGTII